MNLDMSKFQDPNTTSTSWQHIRQDTDYAETLIAFLLLFGATRIGNRVYDNRTMPMADVVIVRKAVSHAWKVHIGRYNNFIKRIEQCQN